MALAINSPHIPNGNGDALWKGKDQSKFNQCDCCPYGYHIDLDFVRFCENVSNRNDASLIKERRRERRRQRQSMEVLLGLTSQTFWNLEQQLPKIPQEPVVTSELPNASATSDLVRDALHRAVQDFEDTLEWTHKTPGNHQPEHLQDGFTDMPVEAARSGDTSLSSMSAVSSPLTSQEVDNEVAMSSAAHEALLQDFDIASIGSATSGHSHAALQNIRQQMALSLERMRDLEEQVKLIPILQVQLSVAKEEKRKIALFMQANKLERSRRIDDETFLTNLNNNSRLKQEFMSTNTSQSPAPQAQQNLNDQHENLLPSASWLQSREMEITDENHRKSSRTSFPSEDMFEECLQSKDKRSEQIILNSSTNLTKHELKDVPSHFITFSEIQEVGFRKNSDWDMQHLVEGSYSLCSNPVCPHQATICLQEEHKINPSISENAITGNKSLLNGSLTRIGRKPHRTPSPKRRSRSASEDHCSIEQIICPSEPHLSEKISAQVPIRRQKPVRNVETQTVNKLATRDISLGTDPPQDELHLLKDQLCVVTKEADNADTYKPIFINSCKGAKKAFTEYFKHMHRNDKPGKMNEQIHTDYFFKQLNKFQYDDHSREESVPKKSVGTQVLTQAKSVASQTIPCVVHRSDAMVQVLPKVRHVEVNAVIEHKSTGTGELDIKDFSCHICESNIAMKPVVDIAENIHGDLNVDITTPTGRKKPPSTVSVHVQTSDQNYLSRNNPKELHTNSTLDSSSLCLKNQFSSEDKKLSEGKEALIKDNSYLIETQDLTTQECESKIPRPKVPRKFTRQNTYTKIDHSIEVQSEDTSLSTSGGSRTLWNSSDLTDHCSEDWVKTLPLPTTSQTKDVTQLDGFRQGNNAAKQQNSTSTVSKDGDSLFGGPSKLKSSAYTPLITRTSPAEQNIICHSPTSTTPKSSNSVISLNKVITVSSGISLVPASSENISSLVHKKSIQDPTVLKPNNNSFIQIPHSKLKLGDLQSSDPSSLTSDPSNRAFNLTESILQSSPVESTSLSVPILHKEPVKPTALVNPRNTENTPGGHTRLTAIKDLGGSSTCYAISGAVKTNLVQLEDTNGESAPMHHSRDDALHLSSTERPTRVEPSRTMKAALKVVNDTLLKSSSSSSMSTGTRDLAGPTTGSALDIIRREWFIISSTREADPNIVEDYLDYFEELSAHLLKCVVNMIDKAGNTAMHYALSTGNFDVVSILLDSKVCDINLPNSAGYTAVMLLSLAKIRSETDRRVLQRFLAYADVNIRAALNGQTALMLAVSQNRLDMVQLLVEGGADLNIQDIDGSTALMCAAEHGLVNMVQYLINQPDADQTIKDLDGSTALDIALDAGHKDVGILLYAHKHFSRNNSPYSSLRGRRSKSATPKPATPTATGSTSTPPPRTTPNSPSPVRARRLPQ